jgi:hypothetical protein
MLLKLLKTIILFFPLCVNAGQVIPVLNNGESMAQIASGALSRIYISGDAINKVTSLSGELLVEKDLENGQIFVKPADENRDRPIEIFITTDAGANFAVSLKPLDIPAQNIGFQVKNKQAKSNGHMNDRAITLIKTLYKGSSDNAKSSIYRNVKDEDLLGGRSELIGWAESQGLVGEVLLVRNTENSEAYIDLTEYMSADVVAMASDKKSILPGDSARIYLVKHYD